MDTTKEATHTPRYGPPHYDGNGMGFEVLGPGGHMYFWLAQERGEHRDDCEKRARVMVCAPDLLKALETHPLPPDDFDTMDGQEAFCDCIMQWLNGPVAAAIAKAKGTPCPS